jgi:hypothetical protein
VGYGGGIYNVVAHRDTVKGSWNTPYFDVIRDIDRFNGENACPELQVITFDEVFAYRLRAKGYRVVNVRDPAWKDRVGEFSGCRVALGTFRGSIKPALHGEFLAVVKGLPHPAEQRQFGFDRFAWFKRRLDPDVPEYAVEASYFTGGR